MSLRGSSPCEQLRPPHIRAGARIDLHRFAFLNEERDIDGLAGLENSGLGDVRRGVAAQTFGRFDNFQLHRRRQLDLDGFAFGVEDLDRQIFDEIIFRLAEEIVLKRHRVVRLRIHEMISVVVLVTELERRAIDVDQLHFIGRAETDVGALAGIDVANDGLDKRAQISRRAMMHVEDNGGVAIVFYRLSFAEIVRGCHGES
jgi:hypothetical protein